MSPYHAYLTANAWCGSVMFPFLVAVSATTFALNLIETTRPWQRYGYIKYAGGLQTRRAQNRAGLTAMGCILNLRSLGCNRPIWHMPLHWSLVTAREIRHCINFTCVNMVAVGTIAGGISAQLTRQLYSTTQLGMHFDIPAEISASSLLLGIFASFYLVARRRRRLLRQELFNTMPERLAEVVSVCRTAYLGTIPLMRLVQQLDSLRGTIALAVNTGPANVSFDIAEKIRSHAVDVVHTLQVCSGEILSEGRGAIPGVSDKLGTIIQRLHEGQWMCLLDEDQLISPPDASDRITTKHRRAWRDPFLLIIGIALLTAVSAVANWAGVGADVIPVVSGAVLLLPLAVWGSRHAAISGTTLFSSLKENAGVVDPPHSAERNAAAGSDEA